MLAHTVGGDRPSSSTRGTTAATWEDETGQGFVFRFDDDGEPVAVRVDAGCGSGGGVFERPTE